MTDETLHEVLRKCCAGDLVAFEQLVTHFQSYAFSLALKFTCDETESEDIVQETFVRIWKHIHRFDHRKKFTTWLYAIVTNLCVDRLRSIRRNRLVFQGENEETSLEEVADGRDLTDIASNEELAAIVRQLTEELPFKQRIIFTLRDLHDLSVEEVSTIARVSVASVKTNLHYARRRIRTLLGERYQIGRLEP